MRHEPRRRTSRLSLTDAKQIIQKVLRERAATWYADNTPFPNGGTLATKLNLLFGVGNMTLFIDEINNLNSAVYNFVETK